MHNSDREEGAQRNAEWEVCRRRPLRTSRNVRADQTCAEQPMLVLSTFCNKQVSVLAKFIDSSLCRWYLAWEISHSLSHLVFFYRKALIAIRHEDREDLYSLWASTFLSQFIIWVINFMFIAQERLKLLQFAFISLAFLLLTTKPHNCSILPPAQTLNCQNQAYHFTLHRKIHT